MFFLCDKSNNILDFSGNTRKLIGLSHKVKKEQEEIIGRNLNMEDIVQNMHRLQLLIEEQGLKFLPNKIMRVRNFKNTTEDGYSTCSITFQEI
jgi:ERCC4-related helicase